MKFRLTSLLWAFALLGSALATFGGAGLIVAPIVVGLWAYESSEKHHDSAGLLTGIGVVVILLALFAPAVQSARESARQRQCRNNLKQLVISLLNYESVNGNIPAAAQSDPNSENPQSWRVRILNFLESNPSFSRYRMDEPWNSPSNAKFAANLFLINTYQCPSHYSGSIDSHYFAVVGENTTWPLDRGRRIREIRDGTSNTLLLIEAPHKSVPWAKPEDLSFDEAVELLTNPPENRDFGHEVDEGFFYKPSRGINVAFCDGHVELLRLPIPEKYAVAMLTADGGEEINVSESSRVRNPELDYGRIYGLCLFVLLSLAPKVKRRSDEPEMVDAEDVEVVEA